LQTVDHPGEERAVHGEPCPPRFVAGICVFLMYCWIYFSKGKRPCCVCMSSYDVIKLISNKAEDAPGLLAGDCSVPCLHGRALACAGACAREWRRGASGLPRQCPGPVVARATGSGGAMGGNGDSSILESRTRNGVSGCERDRGGSCERG
jgi:hypothetical protein